MNRIVKYLMVATVAILGLFGVAGTASATTATTAAQPCVNTSLTGGQASQFDRCTSESANGSWSGLDCIEGVNVDANGNSPFNVFSASNNCPFRVWLHQFKNWLNNGWSFCISPDTTVYGIGAPQQHPLNIYLSENADLCP